MEQTTYERMLLAMGYDESESRILSLIISNRIMTADEIVMDSGISRGKVYQVLKKFEEVGKLYKTKERPANYAMTNNFLEEIKEKVNEVYETITKSLARATRRDEEQIIEEVCNVFQSLGYMIKDVPYGRRVTWFILEPLTSDRLFDYIVEGDYRLAVSFVDKTKEKVVETILESESILAFTISAQEMECINYFLFIYPDFNLADKFYNLVKTGSKDLPVRAFPPLLEKGLPRFIGIENGGPYVIKTSENIKAQIVNAITELRSKKIVVEESEKKISELMEKIDERITDIEVIARNITIRFKRKFLPPIKALEEAFKFLEKIKEPIEDIVNREKRNLDLLRRDYMRLSVEVTDYLDSIRRHTFLPSSETLSKYIQKLETLNSKFEAINFELSSLEENIFAPIYRHPIHRKAHLQYVNPFIFTVPFEPEGPYTIDQEEVQVSIMKMAEAVSGGSTTTFRFLIGDEGIGKSHALKYLAIPVIEEKKIFPLVINCTLKPDLAGCLLAEILDEGKFGKDLLDDIRSLKKERSYTTLRDLLFLLNELVTTCLDHGYPGVVVAIDEYENSLPYIPPKERAEIAVEPLALRQLREILTSSIPHLGILISCRTKDYSMVKNMLGVSNIDQMSLNVERLNEKQTLELINHRYALWKIKKPEFSPDVISEIIQKTSGNTRNIIKYCRELFRYANQKKVDTITKQTLDAVSPIPLFAS